MSEPERDLEANTSEGIELTPNNEGKDDQGSESTPLLQREERSQPGVDANDNSEVAPKPYEPIRTDPLKSMDTRRRRLDRMTDDNIPEIHVVGEIKYGSGIVIDLTEGAFCR